MEMIHIAYTEPDELDISSTPGNFVKLNEALAELFSSSKSELVVWAETTFDPSPYRHVIPKLVIRKTEGPIAVSVRDLDELVIECSESALKALMSFFRFDAGARYPEHHHFEFYEGSPVIHRNSIPVVISLTRDGELAT